MSLEYGIPYGYDMVEIPSSPSVNANTNFGGNNVKFTIEQSQDTCYVGKNSYISIQLQIVQTREDNSYHCLEQIINTGTRALPLCISQPYITSNAGAAIIDSAKCIVKNNEITSYSNVGLANTIYRTLYESKQEQKSVYSTNPINLIGVDDCGVTTGVMYDDYIAVANKLGVVPGANTAAFGALFSKRMIWAIRNNQYTFDKTNTARINIQVPLPLFMCEELLYTGVNDKIELIFGISTRWFQDLIMIAGSNSCAIPAVGAYVAPVVGPPALPAVYAAPAGTPYTVTCKNTGFTACTINVSCTDMRLYLCRGHLTENIVNSLIRENTLCYYMKQFSHTLAQLNGEI